MKGRVLVAGFATRHVAQSAARAGYEVCAVDHFCDQDLFWCTEDRLKFGELDEL
ncbi:MAG: ATP-dependent carboligase, partial [Methanoregula sp.]